MKNGLVCMISLLEKVLEPRYLYNGADGSKDVDVLGFRQ
jgi:hypothetical protein